MRLIIIFSIGVILTLASCGSSKGTCDLPVQVTSEIIKGKVQKTIFNDEKTDSTSCAIDYSFFAPSKMIYRDSVNQKIKKHVIRFTQFESGPMNKLTLSNTFFQSQLDSFAFLCMSEDDYDEGMSHLWELESIIEIEDSQETFAQLQMTVWNYTGGAHGNGSTTTRVIDKLTGNVLLLNDFFSDVDAVTNLAEVYFRELNELDQETDLNDAGFWFENNQFHLNNNFSIEGDYVVFLYNSYEVAPYSGGQTILEIPIEEIRSFIKVEI